jgi:hypothetical protein
VIGFQAGMGLIVKVPVGWKYGAFTAKPDMHSYLIILEKVALTFVKVKIRIKTFELISIFPTECS